MSNVQQRILSAFFLIALLVSILYLGKMATVIVVIVLGMIIIDELYCNFFGGIRFQKNYWINQLSFFAAHLYFNSLHDESSTYILILGAVTLNIMSLFYLFFIDIERSFVLKLIKRYGFLIGPFIFFPTICLSKMAVFTHWIKYIAALLLINFSMDTGAWFFGSRFGRHKLWPKISPKKTVEGLVGGICFASFVGTFYWRTLVSHEDSFWITIPLFAFLALFSQIGDLFQSKLKRECQIKDSSQLIPGHGGVYDRVDSLVFVAPFYIMVLKLIY